MICAGDVVEILDDGVATGELATVISVSRDLAEVRLHERGGLFTTLHMDLMLRFNLMSKRDLLDALQDLNDRRIDIMTAISNMPGGST